MPLQPGPSLSGDNLTISRFLQNPTAIQRRLRSYQDLRFVSDQILTQRFRSSGGAVLYDQSEPFVTDRAVEAVAPGSEYPYANTPDGTAALAAIVKWGQKVKLTDEEIARNALAGSAVDRKFRKVVNSIISKVDAIAMSAVGSALANTATAGIWDSGTLATRAPLTDIMLAIQRITDRNAGYSPDTLVVSPKGYTYLMLNGDIRDSRARETTSNPIYTGSLERVVGLAVLVTPNMPTATSAFVLDSRELGGMADETDGAPGYSVDALAVQVKAIRRDESDSWDLQGRRKTVPVVLETGAGEEITGVVS